MWTFYTPCVSVAVSGDFCHETARKCKKFYNIRVSLLNFLPWKRPRLGGLPHLETFTWRIVTPADRVTLHGRPGNPPRPVTLKTYCIKRLELMKSSFSVFLGKKSSLDSLSQNGLVLLKLRFQNRPISTSIREKRFSKKNNWI